MDSLNIPALPAGNDISDGAKATAGAAALNHIVNQGLVVPLRSSIVRNIVAVGELSAYAITAVPMIYAESVALTDQWNAMRAGTCQNIGGLLSSLGIFK